jgi:hypothetical protein
MTGESIGIIITVVGICATVIAFFFKAKEELKDKIHGLELKIKDLEHKDELQQKIIDTLPNVFSVINRLQEQKGGENGNK